jgi:aspartate/methionine/tyrosine aminotransferase
MFSSRVRSHLETNRIAAAVLAHRRSGAPLLDLTVTNPTACGLEYPADILQPLADPSSCLYAPEPLGLRVAREAVAADYARRGIGVARGGVNSDRIVLTASTSEAYSLLFKLLCEPSGDDVLVPAPSYPLFEHLTMLDGVTARPYALDYQGRWELDTASVDAAWTSRVRAVLGVSPNNPTGSVLTPAELRDLSARCASGRAALILDEVFADYPLRKRTADPAFDAGTPPALTFRLGGLSKSAGLPQVKLGWILVDGPEELVREALDRLELICDTYLSVSTPVQVAAPRLIEQGAAVREGIGARLRGNLEVLLQLAATVPAVQVLPPDAGWTVVIRVPAQMSEEELVLSLLREREVLVHPGFFFDFAHEAFLVLSLLPEPSVFADGASRVLGAFDA